eukprot:6209808-Prymnesium_polylepis.2
MARRAAERPPASADFDHHDHRFARTHVLRATGHRHASPRKHTANPGARRRGSDVKRDCPRLPTPRHTLELPRNRATDATAQQLPAERGVVRRREPVPPWLLEALGRKAGSSPPLHVTNMATGALAVTLSR